MLVSPSKTWEIIASSTEGEKRHLTDYFYPLIGLVAFTAFLNPFIKGHEQLDFRGTLAAGVQFFVVSFASGFFGFFVAARLLNTGLVRWFGQTSDKNKAEVLTVYASTPVLVVSILTRLLSDFFFMKVLFFYVVVLVWDATKHFYSLEESKRGRFTALGSIIILSAPMVVEKVLFILLPGLNK